MRMSNNDFVGALAFALGVGFLLGLLLSYAWCP